MYGISPIYLRLNRGIMIVIATSFLIVFQLTLRQTGCLNLNMKTLPFIEPGVTIYQSEPQLPIRHDSSKSLFL